MSKYLIFSFLIIALCAGIGLGYMLSPQYKKMQYEESQMMDLGKADKYVDLRYIDAMIAHHKSAMVLAEQVKDSSQRQEIKDLAAMILTAEPNAIEELYQWKKNWYGDTRQIQASEVPNLGTYDEKLDWRFLNALIAHHEMGVSMTKEAKMKSTRNEVLNNAAAVEDFLKGGIDMLSKLRESWYGVN